MRIPLNFNAPSFSMQVIRDGKVLVSKQLQYRRNSVKIGIDNFPKGEYTLKFIGADQQELQSTTIKV